MTIINSWLIHDFFSLPHYYHYTVQIDDPECRLNFHYADFFSFHFNKGWNMKHSICSWWDSSLMKTLVFFCLFCFVVVVFVLFVCLVFWGVKQLFNVVQQLRNNEELYLLWTTSSPTVGDTVDLPWQRLRHHVRKRFLLTYPPNTQLKQNRHSRISVCMCVYVLGGVACCTVRCCWCVCIRFSIWDHILPL